MKKAGQEMISYCTQCKMDLNHVIIAMKGVIIAKVQCLTCRGEHLYHPKKGANEPQKKRASTESEAEARNPVHSVSQEWQRLMELHRSSPFQPYSMKHAFSIGDRIQHPQFGEGIVQKVIYPNKIDVIFREVMKTLIHAQEVVQKKS